MSSTLSQETVKIFKSGGVWWTAMPSLVTMPVDPTQPLKSPSICGMGKQLCQASGLMAQDPTLTSSPVGRTTSMLVISCLFNPYLAFMWPIPWLMAQEETEEEGGPNGQPSLRLCWYKASAS